MLHWTLKSFPISSMKLLYLGSPVEDSQSKFFTPKLLRLIISMLALSLFYRFTSHKTRVTFLSFLLAKKKLKQHWRVWRNVPEDWAPGSKSCSFFLSTPIYRQICRFVLSYLKFILFIFFHLFFPGKNFWANASRSAEMHSGYEYRRNLFDYWQHYIRHWPRLLQAKFL